MITGQNVSTTSEGAVKGTVEQKPPAILIRVGQFHLLPHTAHARSRIACLLDEASQRIHNHNSFVVLENRRKTRLTKWKNFNDIPRYSTDLCLFAQHPFRVLVLHYVFKVENMVPRAIEEVLNERTCTKKVKKWRAYACSQQTTHTCLMS